MERTFELGLPAMAYDRSQLRFQRLLAATTSAIGAGTAVIGASQYLEHYTAGTSVLIASSVVLLLVGPVVAIFGLISYRGIPKAATRFTLTENGISLLTAKGTRFDTHWTDPMADLQISDWRGNPAAAGQPSLEFVLFQRKPVRAALTLDAALALVPRN